MRMLRAAIIIMLLGIISVMSPRAVSANANTWITVDPPSSPVQPSSRFSTQVSMTSWNGVVGAIDINICYDPAVIHIVDFTVPQESPFFSNLEINRDSYSSGKTRIAGIQTRDNEAWAKPVAVCILTWETNDIADTTTDITIEVTSVVDVKWGPIDVMTYGQTISIAEQPSQVISTAPTSELHSATTPAQNTAITQSASSTVPTVKHTYQWWLWPAIGVVIIIVIIVVIILRRRRSV